MESPFRAVADEFCIEVRVLHDLVSSFENPEVQPRVRAAASNSAMLLLAATFEGFVRNMAREVARAAVAKAGVVAHIPNRILRTAWKRTFESIVRMDLPQNTRTRDIHEVVSKAEVQAKAVFTFLKGNTKQDIYTDLVQNDFNMRAQEINRLFGMSEVSDVCSLVSQELSVIDHFHAEPTNATSVELGRFIDDFIQQRNHIAHALTSSYSVGPQEVCSHINTFCVFAQALCAVLERRFPSTTTETGGSAAMTQP